ncbi:unnamed protein product [Arabis nemorensis]|uniref:Transcription elongation factor spt6 n=1 Tax=Arabis nemorensis TaxID=586526 RepID=A0A565BVD6_9BRAS|nr:unnamed protein product [Arabis nemorensis]
MPRNTIFDDEEDIEVEDEEGEPVHGEPFGDNDDEEEYQDGEDVYENDGFRVSEEESDNKKRKQRLFGERQDSDEERQIKKKRRWKKDEDLDEDDYLLLQDNNVKFLKRKYKRLKKAQRENVDLPTDVGDEEELAVEEDVVEREDEMADFIVDEEWVDLPKRGDAKKMKNSAMQEAYEIFGGVNHLLKKRKEDLASSNMMERRREDDSEKYMTGKDVDIPERMQKSEQSTGSPLIDEISIKKESNWIYAQLMLELKDSDGQGFSVNETNIEKFLELHHVQKLEIPFIAMYRKEQCRSLLESADGDDVNLEKKPGTKWHKVFWMIQDLDRKWLLLQKRKMALHGYYRKRQEESRRVYNESSLYDESKLALNQYLFGSVVKFLKGAETEIEVDDVASKFNLHFPPCEIGVDEGQYKKPARISKYRVCSNKGLGEVANKFGYSAEQLGLALSGEKLVRELEDAKETPEEMALNFVCAMFKNPQAVLKGAQHMAAVEIYHDPSVKKYVRGIYMENAVISTHPTAAGRQLIDSFHQFSGVKWLREKPLSKFEGTQWLLIQKAEKEKLLEVTFKLPENFINGIISDCNEHYLSSGVSKYAQLWNEQRKLILEVALHTFLLPSMQKEAKSLLTCRAKSRLLSEYRQALWNKVSAGPYLKKDMDISSDEEAAPRVMACCCGSGNQPNTFVMLDSSGELLDVLLARSLTLRSQNVNDQQRKKSDQDLLLQFMMNHQPHVVALGAVNLSCTHMKDDTYKVISQMDGKKPRDVGHGMDDLRIVYVDESLPRLYEISLISGEQLPQQSGIVKRAVALGRYVQNPLAMVATLCGPGREILSWKLHPLEDFLPLDEQSGMVEQVMVDITNQVGIDINLAASHEWLFSPLQFISGLGPRKAASLQRSLVRAGSIFGRKDLKMHGLGKKVFVNAAGFLRIRRSGLAASSSQFIDLLDDTRIHPESYGLAQELVKYIYDQNVRGDSNDDESALAKVTTYLRDQRTSFALDYYFASKKQGYKKETFSNIMRELSCGFQDWRIPFKDPSPDEVFYMISGETEETICEGRIVHATVQEVLCREVICELDSGLTGIMTKEDYADDGKFITNLSARLKKGQLLMCKIKSIKKEECQVVLICKESEMRNIGNQHKQNVDPYYFEDRNSTEAEKEKARKQKDVVNNHFLPRKIVHPCFQNFSTDEAIEFLSSKDYGEFIFRPSSQGLDYLTLTLKIYDGVYTHTEIIEGKKGNIYMRQHIGETLTIREDIFMDLCEVMDRYVDPLVTHLKTMLNYRKFRKGTKSEVDELLRIEKGENPTRIVYCFGISHEHPGTFILSYIRNKNPHQEYVGLYPKGFEFREMMFEDIDRLVEYFQNSLHETVPLFRSVAVMVPMRSPADRGSFGGSDWGGSQSKGVWKGNSDRSSAPRGGRGGAYRNGGGRDGHPPRPHGGRGRGRGWRNSDRQDRTGDWGYNNAGTGGGGWGNNAGGKKGSFGGSGWGGSQSKGVWKGNSDRSSAPRGGRGGAYRNGGGRDGHPPRPHGGCGRCGGRRNGDRQDRTGDWGYNNAGTSGGGWGNDAGGKKGRKKAVWETNQAAAERVVV